MIEGNVFLENHDDMFDRRLRREIVAVICEGWTSRQQRDGRSGHRRHRLAKAVMHIESLLWGAQF